MGEQHKSVIVAQVPMVFYNSSYIYKCIYLIVSFVCFQIQMISQTEGKQPDLPECPATGSVYSLSLVLGIFSAAKLSSVRTDFDMNLNLKSTPRKPPGPKKKKPPEKQIRGKGKEKGISHGIRFHSVLGVPKEKTKYRMESIHTTCPRKESIHRVKK